MSTAITVTDCVDFAIKTEQELSVYYERMANNFADDAEIANLFKSLSADEQHHQAQFKKLLQDDSFRNTVVSARNSDYLKAMSLSKAFSKNIRNQDLNYIPDNREELLLELFEFEKASLGFYKALIEVVIGNTELQKIIEMEKSHVIAVMKILVTNTPDMGL